MSRECYLIVMCHAVRHPRPHPSPTFPKNLGVGYVPCTVYVRSVQIDTDQENDFEFIPTVKMGTDPVQGSFGSEFPSIYNQCGVMHANHKTLTISEKFWRFLEKRPLTVKFSKFCSESFHRDTDRRCCVQMS